MWRIGAKSAITKAVEFDKEKATQAAFVYLYSASRFEYRNCSFSLLRGILSTRSSVAQW